MPVTNVRQKSGAMNSAAKGIISISVAAIARIMVFTTTPLSVKDKT
jgi:hypothetical protein